MDRKEKTVYSHIYHLAIKYGLIAGISIVIWFVLTLLMLGEQVTMTNMLIRYFKFVILAVVIWSGLKTYRFKYHDTFKFTRGMKIGFGISAIAAVTIIVAEILTSIIAPGYVLEPYLQPPDEGGRLIGMVLSFFETTLIGGIIFSMGFMFRLQRKVTEDTNE